MQLLAPVSEYWSSRGQQQLVVIKMTQNTAHDVTSLAAMELPSCLLHDLSLCEGVRFKLDSNMVFGHYVEAARCTRLLLLLMQLCGLLDPQGMQLQWSFLATNTHKVKRLHVSACIYASTR